MISKNITDSNRKKAMLLHYGGLDLQDVFYTLRNADVLVEGEDPYEKANALSMHFRLKVNIASKKHAFRKIKQKKGEPMGQYVTRLRQQAKNCEFQA